jgi:hypothetical protein
VIVHLPGPLHPVEVLDAGEGMCCAGAVHRGPAGCTCWEAVYDPADQVPLADCDRAASDLTRPRMCGDCAFRADSPERAGEGRYQNSEPGDLERVAAGATPFRCHDGARRIVALVHTPTGHRIDLAGVDHYDPPTADRPYAADGKPLLVCAGWAAAHTRAVGR